YFGVVLYFRPLLVGGLPLLGAAPVEPAVLLVLSVAVVPVALAVPLVLAAPPEPLAPESLELPQPAARHSAQHSTAAVSVRDRSVIWSRRPGSPARMAGSLA